MALPRRPQGWAGEGSGDGEGRRRGAGLRGVSRTPLPRSGVLPHQPSPGPGLPSCPRRGEQEKWRRPWMEKVPAEGLLLVTRLIPSRPSGRIKLFHVDLVVYRPHPALSALPLKSPGLNRPLNPGNSSISQTHPLGLILSFGRGFSGLWWFWEQVIMTALKKGSYK